MRRVVTGVNSAGRSVVLSDGNAPRAHDFIHIPGMKSTLIWATLQDNPTLVTTVDPTPSLTRDLPAAGETRFLVVRFPPDSVYAHHFDATAAQREQQQISPELAATFEVAQPGMHTTDTVDYILVVEGEIYLELDDNAGVTLRAGDVVVQNGARHAWRNRSDSAAILACIMIGRRNHI